MNKVLLQVVGLLFLGSLLVQEASAGVAIAPTANFNTFSFTQDGAIMSLGLNEGSSLNTMLSTTVTLGGGIGVDVSGFSLGLTFSGSGAVTGMVPNLGSCTLGSSCNVMAAFNFESMGIIQPGDMFSVTGNIFYDGDLMTSLATATDSFTATAVPEPGVLALIAIGFAGLGFTRYKTARC